MIVPCRAWSKPASSGCFSSSGCHSSVFQHCGHSISAKQIVTLWVVTSVQLAKLQRDADQAEVVANGAEETAAAAMQRAGGAVRDEMEAAAVVKETQHALAKALQGLRDLGPKEDQAAQDAARCDPAA